MFLAGVAGRRSFVNVLRGLMFCRVYPYNCRYRLYGSWKSDTYAIHPPLMRKRVEVQKKAKAIMQRISKENVKPTSRKIGKVTNSSPGLMFDYVSISLLALFIRSGH